ncbi:sulfite exporter TauE/SafE family protein [Brumicola blandensis]|uniref:Probable membrane transporter protein n=1 Tax=Brumicola blandensis TaxID=3075611 RepID=A0AAW8QYI7_9ALTE|nr:sulfite exporter TauE/SafE family protein [Alteromonas sp. W409]MDT0581047.1 sulfite exporter TauE/SafE family protein [Alteromonas sp. W409]
MFDISVWVGAICMGLSLGLLGSGGSILTVPLLVYLAHEPQKIAIAESLLIVGIVALVGSINHILKRKVAFRSVLAFGLPSMASALLGAYASHWVSGQVQLLTFAVIMLAASVFMLKPVSNNQEQQTTRQTLSLLLAGLFVGALAGFVGVGGGFLIVPALLLFANTPMKAAVATSLVIIAMQSFAGFSQYAFEFAKTNTSLNWPLIALVSTFAVAGSFVGMFAAERLPQQHLKKLFGIALIPLSTFIFISNF